MTLWFTVPRHSWIVWLSNLLILSFTWWRLIQKLIVHTKSDIYVFIALFLYFFVVQIGRKINQYNGIISCDMWCTFVVAKNHNVLFLYFSITKILLIIMDSQYIQTIKMMVIHGQVVSDRKNNFRCQIGTKIMRNLFMTIHW